MHREGESSSPVQRIDTAILPRESRQCLFTGLDYYYGVPFVPKCLTFCGNLENLAPMKRAVFMISFSFLVNKHLDLVNRCLDLFSK